MPSSLKLIPLLLLSQSALAYIVIHNQEFLARGGDPLNLADSLTKVYAPLQAASLKQPFSAVGLLDAGAKSCTATWLGDSPDQHSIYLLTAAHCLPDNAANHPEFSAQFTDWSGKVVARGEAHGDMHPGWARHWSDMNAIKDDLAVVELPKLQPLLDPEQRPVTPPWIYDGDQEVSQPVEWVGYGEWGVSSLSAAGFDQPAPENRRAWFRTRVTGLGQNERSLKVSGALLPSKEWARSGRGDSGSAWWQQQHGLWTIVSTTHGILGNASIGPRLSRHAQWIRTIYPQVALFSQQITVSHGKPVRIADAWQQPRQGGVAYIVPAPGRGPVALERLSNSTPSRFSVPLSNAQQQNRVYPVTLRAAHCSAHAMNSLTPCAPGENPALSVSFHREDNPELPPGRYFGEIGLQARGTQDAAYQQGLTLLAVIQMD